MKTRHFNTPELNYYYWYYYYYYYYSIDKLKEDIEIVADKLVFDELIQKENQFFNQTKAFNPNKHNGEKMITEFGTIYSRSTWATVRAIHGVKDEVYQYEVQLDSNGSICVGWATENCTFNEIHSGVGIYDFFT